MHNREEIINFLISDIKKKIDSDKVEPDFYLYILLLSSEMLEVQDDNGYWKNVFYNYVVKINKIISKTNYFSLSMIGGLGLLAFCCDNFYKKTGLLEKFTKSTIKSLTLGIKSIYKDMKLNSGVESYDLINGVSGYLYFLLDLEGYDNEINMLIGEAIDISIEFLEKLTEPKLVDNKEIVGYFIENENLFILDKKRFKKGLLDFGMAHGMIAPAISLGKAYSKGYFDTYLYIKKILDIYEEFKYDFHGMLIWPDKLSLEDYFRKDMHYKSFSINSWCYGSLSILKGLEKCYTYLEDYEKTNYYKNYKIRILNKEFDNIFSTSLCHGIGSILMIKDIESWDEIDKKYIEKIGYLYSNYDNLLMSKKFNNINSINMIEENSLENLSFLTGTVGTLLCLINNKNLTYKKLLMID